MLTIEIHTGLGSVNSERNFPFWRTIPLKICILQRHRLISLYIPCSILMNYTHKAVWIFFFVFRIIVLLDTLKLSVVDWAPLRALMWLLMVLLQE